MQTQIESDWETFRNDIEPELAAKRPRVIEEDEPGCFLNARPPVKRGRLKSWRKSGQMRLTRAELGRTSDP